MIEKYQGYTEVRKIGQGFRPVGKHAFKLICNARAVKYDLIQQFDEVSDLEAVSILLNVLIADARGCTDIDSFIKTIISMWGTYDEAEGKS